MTTRIRLAVFGCVVFIALFGPVAVRACCPAPPSGKPVVNADQTVILIWDPATKTEHFIRKATFKSEADDFGFLIPSPTQTAASDSRYARHTWNASRATERSQGSFRLGILAELKCTTLRTAQKYPAVLNPEIES